ncbi:MAG: adenosylcobinamide-GDP ribazoletransferase [Methanomassiliicoccales archaeon]
MHRSTGGGKIGLRGIIKAQFSLFTILPAHCGTKEIEALSRHFYLIPIIGAFFGLVAGGLFLLSNHFLSGLMAAVLTLLLVHALNRFLHIDGLSDLGDGLLAGGGREKKVAVMKDSRSGAGGIAYVLFFELLAVASLAAVGEEDKALWFLAPFVTEVLCKNAVVACAASGRPVEGLGGLFVRNTKGWAPLLSTILSLIIILPLAVSISPLWGCECPFQMLVIIFSMVLASLMSGLIMAKVAMRNFAMVNGDVLGATNEIARPVILIILLVVLRCFELVQW